MTDEARRVRTPLPTVPGPHVVRVLRWFKWRRWRIAVVEFADGDIRELSAEQLELPDRTSTRGTRR